MKPIEIIEPEDERLRIPFTVKGKGRKPLSFSLPRFDFLSEDQFEDMSAALDAVNKDKDMTVHKRNRAASLTMMKPFVTPAQYAVLETLASGQLDQIVTAWTEQSQVSLGEFLASSGSSTESTVRPSTVTSLSGDGGEETSGAA